MVVVVVIVVSVTSSDFFKIKSLIGLELLFPSSNYNSNDNSGQLVDSYKVVLNDHRHDLEI